MCVDIKDVIERCRLLESDHSPEGWPAIQMKDITVLLDYIEYLEAKILNKNESNNEQY